MQYKEILFELRDNVAWITINRPAALNAISVGVATEMADAALRCEADPDVRCVVLTGAGDRAFCAGGDVLAFAADPEHVDALMREMTKQLHGAIATLSRLNAPVVAAVNGTVAGGGLGLFSCADLAIAVEGAKFTSAYTKIGLTPDGSSTYHLSRMIGRRRAAELLLTNRVLSAQEALEWGIINRVVPAAALRDEVTALAKMLSEGPTAAHGGIKRLLDSALQASLVEQMQHEADSIATLARQPDGLEGVNAFANKRVAKFIGR